MTTQNDKLPFDLRGLLTTVVASALVSTASFVWYMSGLDSRVNVLERDSSKVDQILVKVNELSEKVAIMNIDVAYVKQNMADLKLNSNSLSDDVRNLRISVTDLQKGNNSNGRQ